MLKNYLKSKYFPVVGDGVKGMIVSPLLFIDNEHMLIELIDCINTVRRLFREYFFSYKDVHVPLSAKPAAKFSLRF